MFNRMYCRISLSNDYDFEDNIFFPGRIQHGLVCLDTCFVHRGTRVVLHGMIGPRAQEGNWSDQEENAIYALNVSVANKVSVPQLEDLDMQQLLSEFANVFADMPSQLPPKRDVDHTIVLEPSSKPIHKIPYRLSKVDSRKWQCRCKS